jgi:hypothetical protein
VRTGALELDTENPGDVGGWTPTTIFRCVLLKCSYRTAAQKSVCGTIPNRPGAAFRSGVRESFGGIVGFSAAVRPWQLATQDAAQVVAPR